jgi:hypothetical protein
MPLHLLSERSGAAPARPGEPSPAFGQNGKRDITIYCAVAQGWHPDDSPLGDPTSPSCCSIARRSCASSARLHPTGPAATMPITHLTAGFVVAVLVEKISGRSFRAFFRENITAPLKLESLDFGARGPLSRKVARNYVAGFRLGGPVDRYLKRAIGTGIEHAVALSNDPRF